jgi:HEAT repeat protein
MYAGVALREGGSLRGLLAGVLIGAAAGLSGGWTLFLSTHPEASGSGEAAAALRREAASLRAEILSREMADRAALEARAGAPAGEPASADGEAPLNGPGEDLAAEAKRLRDELAAWRKLPARTAELLEKLTDASASAADRIAAAEALVGQCDAPAHVAEIIAALGGETDPAVRRALLESMGKLAVKSGSEELHGAVLDAARKGPEWIPASRMLGALHRRDGIEVLGQLLDDTSPGIRWAATRALGQEVSGESTTAALRAARASGDPGVRGLSALYLAKRNEPFAYEGMVDDWRDMIYGLRMDDLQALDLPRIDQFFTPLSWKDKSKMLLLLGEIAQRHTDEEVRERIGEAMKQFPAAAPEGEGAER